jgi:putative RecB family exonuclease
LESLVLSASAIEAYDRCPLKYSLQKLWRLPEEPSAALQYGSAMHTALKDFYDAAKQGRRRTADETVEIFMRLFESAKIEEDLQRQLYERQGAEQLRQFVAARELEQAPDVIATEKPIRFMIEDVTIIGRIDRIDRTATGGLVVIDYKTGNPKSDLDASGSVQLGLYGLAVQLEGNTVERMVFYNLEDNSTAETERINERKLHETVLDVAAGIRAGRFEPKPGFQCNYCGYRSLCPATAEQIFARPETKVAVGVK